MKFLLKFFIFGITTKCVFPFFSPFEANNDVLFILRTKNSDFRNPEIYTNIKKESLDENSLFNASKPTFFLIHGYMQDRTDNTLNLLCKNLLEKSDINLFFVDWGKGSKTFDYSTARANINLVAEVIADFHGYLNQNFGIDSSKTTCVGFSLGAHACGLVYQHLSSDKFGRVIGLDPAGPLFDINDKTTRISADSASYVECIHTGFPLGIRAPICQADFFANKGLNQPGCENFFKIDSPVCSHYRAVIYYIESLQNEKAFFAENCDNSLELALKESCHTENGTFMNADENAEQQISGIYSLVTNSKSPYGKGKV